MSDTLVVNEIYLSLQGESTFAGQPCVFVRLTGCNLRCSYCDTAYAFTAGRRQPLAEVLAEIHQLAGRYATAAVGPRLPLVELTGGEPLLQPGAIGLMRQLCEDGFTVLVETSGAVDITPVDARVHRIMDLKCPSSGEVERNRWANLPHLRATDELKFVIATVEDYEWAKATLREHGIAAVCPVLFSWVTPLTPEQRDPALNPTSPVQTPLTRRELVERLLVDALPVRFQLQMHKFIWPPQQRGV